MDIREALLSCAEFHQNVADNFTYKASFEGEPDHDLHAKQMTDLLRWRNQTWADACRIAAKTKPTPQQQLDAEYGA